MNRESAFAQCLCLREPPFCPPRLSKMTKHARDLRIRRCNRLKSSHTEGEQLCSLTIALLVEEGHTYKVGEDWYGSSKMRN